MSDIKLSTDVLNDNSIQLSEASSELNRIQKIIAAATPGGFLYKGQLRNKFEQISSGVDQLSAKLHDRQEELAKELSDRAKKFEAANQTNNATMVTLFDKSINQVNNSPILKALAGLGQLDLAKANYLWTLGGFTGISIFLLLISKLPFFSGENVIVEPPSYSKEVNITTNINLRDSAAYSGKKLAELPAGSVVTQITEKPITNKIDKYTWINVRTSDGKEGWIASDKLASPSEPKTNGKIATTGPVQGSVVKLNDGIHSGDRTGNLGVAIDIGASDPKIAEIHSLGDGTVKKIGPSKFELDKDNNKIPDGKGSFKLTGYGNYVVILQEDEKIVIYAHLVTQPALKIGDTVKANEKIGMMGNTGNVIATPPGDGSHLHLEFRQPVYKDDKYAGYEDATLINNHFDPFEYLKSRGFTI